MTTAPSAPNGDVGSAKEESPGGTRVRIAEPEYELLKKLASADNRSCPKQAEVLIQDAFARRFPAEAKQALSRKGAKS